MVAHNAEMLGFLLISGKKEHQEQKKQQLLCTVYFISKVYTAKKN